MCGIAGIAPFENSEDKKTITIFDIVYNPKKHYYANMLKNLI